MPNGSFLSYKGRRTRKKKGSRVERTKCCRSDSGRFSVFCCIAFCAGFRGGSRCLEDRPSASGSTSAQLPFLCVEADRHRHLFAALLAVRRSLFACIYSVPIVRCIVLITRLFAYIYIRILSFVASTCISVCLRSLCRRAVPLCSLWSCVIGSLSFSSLSCSSVQDPRGPASFLHALAQYHDNAVTLTPNSKERV